MKDTIRQLIQQALTQLVNEGVLPEGLTPAIQVENARDKTHGDFASNIAMMLAKQAGMKPRDLAEKLIAAMATLKRLALRSRHPEHRCGRNAGHCGRGSAAASATGRCSPVPGQTRWT